MGETRHHERTFTRVAWAASWVSIVGATTVLGFTVLFSRFAPYDDDGYFLITIKGYLSGADLYDETSGQYGPFYFAFMAGVIKLFGLAVTNDASRGIALGFWVGTSLLLAVAAHRLGHTFLAGAVYVLAFFVLMRAPNEPAHPGHLVVFALAAVVALTATLVERRQRLAFTIAGALTAAALLSKVNVGLFAIAALVFAAALSSPRLLRSHTLTALVSAGYVLVPLALISRDVRFYDFRVFTLHVLLGALGVAIVSVATARRGDRDGGAAWWLGYAVGGALGLAVLVCGLVVAQGTSLTGLAHGVLLDALEQPKVFTAPLVLRSHTIFVDAVAVAGAVVIALRALPQSPPWPTIGAVARIASGVWIWASIVGSDPLGMPVTLAWVAAVPTRRDAPTPARRFIRIFLPALAVLQALHAYPVAGSQVSWGTLLFVLVGAVCVSDGIDQLASAFELRAQRVVWLGRIGAIALVAMVVAGALVVPLRDSIQAYRSGVPVRTAGTAWLRLPSTRARDFESVVATIRARCSTFVSMPGLGSLYLMSQKTPPTWIQMSGWLFLWDARTQQRVVDQVDSVPDLCAIRYPAMEALWAGGRPIPDRPLRAFILEEFQPIESIGEFLVLKRKTS